MSSSSANTNVNTGTKGVASKKNENKPPKTAGASKIVAWGTTTGKLYLDDARLGDPKSRGAVLGHIVGKGDDKEVGAKADVSTDGRDGRSDGGAEAKDNHQSTGDS